MGKRIDALYDTVAALQKRVRSIDLRAAEGLSNDLSWVMEVTRDLNQRLDRVIADDSGEERMLALEDRVQRAAIWGAGVNDRLDSLEHDLRLLMDEVAVQGQEGWNLERRVTRHEQAYTKHLDSHLPQVGTSLSAPTTKTSPSLDSESGTTTSGASPATPGSERDDFSKTVEKMAGSLSKWSAAQAGTDKQRVTALLATSLAALRRVMPSGYTVHWHSVSNGYTIEVSPPKPSEPQDSVTQESPSPSQYGEVLDQATQQALSRWVKYHPETTVNLLGFDSAETTPSLATTQVPSTTDYLDSMSASSTSLFNPYCPQECFPWETTHIASCSYAKANSTHSSSRSTG